jgi:predicted Rossmann fold nucleotide-binding protein DprA/Smf involved in DNA uptake
MTLAKQAVVIQPGSPAYPAALAKIKDHDANLQIWAVGSIGLLRNLAVGFFCSSQCPGSIVLKTFDTIVRMRDDGQTLIGGFHSVMEWECLRILLRGRQPIIWVPARSIIGMNLKPELRPAFEEGRLLILSPFPPAQNRITTALAQRRNRFVAALADKIFVPHAAPASRTLEHCRELATEGKSILTIDDQLNNALLHLRGVERFS